MLKSKTSTEFTLVCKLGAIFTPLSPEVTYRAFNETDLWISHRRCHSGTKNPMEVNRNTIASLKEKCLMNFVLLTKSHKFSLLQKPYITLIWYLLAQSIGVGYTTGNISQEKLLKQSKCIVGAGSCLLLVLMQRKLWIGFTTLRQTILIKSNISSWKERLEG